MTVEPEPFDSPDAAALRAELAADIARRYEDEETEPGSKPTAGDMLVFLVARDDVGVAVGCGGLRAIEPGLIEVKRMYVRPDARGTGVAPALLAALEAEARAHGATRVVLETGPGQPEAIALYAKHGYRQIPCYGAYSGEPLSLCFERVL